MTPADNTPVQADALVETPRILRWLGQVIENAEKHGSTEGLWLFASQWKVVQAALLAHQPTTDAEAEPVAHLCERVSSVGHGPAHPPADKARIAEEKPKRLPKLPQELYENYPAMSAQTHEAEVKAYARAALENRNLGQGEGR